MKPSYEELERMLEESRREIRSADITMQNLEAKCENLAAENAGLKLFKTAVYQQMGAGCEAPEFSITEGLSNLRRFADTLHAIEREFFTKEVPDEECEGETVEECPLGWEMSVEQYVSEFRKCLAEVRAQAQSEVIEWLDAEITAIDTMYRGDPSYEHDAYWMKSNVLDVVELARKAFAAQIRKGVQS